MRKKIKRYGNSAVISFTKSELELYELNVDDIVDFTFTKIIKNKKKRC